MSRFQNIKTGSVVSVADEKDHRFSPLEWRPAGDGEGYAALKVADLRAEIERRNEGRDDADLLPLEGKKADLVAVLDADDAAASE